MSDWINRCAQGDCRDLMRAMAADGVRAQTCVTSPPYYALRDYGVAGQIGLEASPEKYVAAIVEVFDCVWELLADDGTCWINLGDSYAQSGGPGWQGKNGQRADRRFTASRDTVPMCAAGRQIHSGYKPKDLLGMPWRVAFALQEAGWYLRQDIIWHKPNPMPESVRDRCTKAHEYLFLLSKSERYYFDQEAIKEPASANTNPRRAGKGWKTPDGWDTSSGEGGHGSFHRGGREKGRTGYEHKPSGPRKLAEFGSARRTTTVSMKRGMSCRRIVTSDQSGASPAKHIQRPTSLPSPAL